jgi:hypothetical protein
LGFSFGRLSEGDVDMAPDWGVGGGVEAMLGGEDQTTEVERRLNADENQKQL